MVERDDFSLKKRRNTNQQKQSAASGGEKGTSIGDVLHFDIAEKLKNLKKEKEQEWQKKKEEEEAKRQFEQKQREKNKSFEELLNETPLDWKKFK
jgi:hypothetical protein